MPCNSNYSKKYLKKWCILGFLTNGPFKTETAMKKLIVTSLLLLFSLNIFAAEDTESATRTLVWSDGTRYVGGVEDGKRSGKGTTFWQDGACFVG